MEQAIETTKTDLTKKHKEKINKPKLRKKIQLKWIILGIVVIVAAAIAIMCSMSPSGLSSLLSYEDTSLIEQSDLTYSISATGTVMSMDSQNVYSTQAYTVQEVFVKVGDTVTKGEALCKLDSGMLEDQIAKMELSMGITAQAAKQQVKTARDSYNAAKSALDEGLNSGLVSAQSQVDSAYNNWIKAQKAYNEYRESLNTGTNSQLLQQERAVQAAQESFYNAQRDYSTAKSSYDSAVSKLNSYTRPTASDAEVAEALIDYNAKKVALDIAQNEYDNKVEAAALLGANDPDRDDADKEAADAGSRLTDAQIAFDKAQAIYTQKQLLANAQGPDTTYQALSEDASAKKTALEARERAVHSAQTAYDSAVRQLNAAYSSSDNALGDYSLAVDIAYQGYQTALESLAATETSTQTQLQSSKNALESTKISANDDISVMDLALMQEDLEETTITAPTSGTITAVFAKVGNSGSGLLFVIEDTNNLKVETTVKEYDIGTVSVGLPVTIRSDAIVDKIIDGSIVNIAPASQKNAAGGIDTSGEVVFPTEVKVIGKDTGLRIGMSVRLNYIIEHKSNVLSVPYEAVYINDGGQSCVLIATEQADGKHLIGELAVTTGMETDLSMQVSGDGVSAGLRVVNNPDSFLSLIGQSITLAEHRVSTGGFSPIMMGG